MRTVLLKISVFFFSFIPYFVFSVTPLEEIYTRCDGIEISCANIVRYTTHAIRDIENETFTYVAYSNGYPVTTTVRIKEIGGFGENVEELQRIYDESVQISNRSGLIRQLATQISSSGGGSYDDTDLLSELEDLEKLLSDILEDTVKINDNLDQLNTYLEDTLTPFLDNIGSYTNNLDYILTSITNFYFGRVTSPFNTIKYDSSRFGSPIWYAIRDNSNTPMRFSGLSYALTIPNYRQSYTSLFDLITSGILNQQYNLGSLNNFSYTNLQQNISFHRDIRNDFKAYSDFTTNKITEINSIFYNKSPLEDLQNDVNPSNIYNFVTNYYIKVSTDPSGSASENKTNWFNRIEMLLTALVFRPGETASSNDFSNATETQSQAFSDSLKSVLNDDITEVQSKSTDVKEEFVKTKDSLLKFFNHLDDKLGSLASMPSHIEFFEVTVKGQKKKVEISTASNLGKIADVFRSITTLCWISFFVYLIYVLSIWLFHKFSTILKFCYVVFKTLIGIG